MTQRNDEQISRALESAIQVRVVVDAPVVMITEALAAGLNWLMSGFLPEPADSKEADSLRNFLILALRRLDNQSVEAFMKDVEHLSLVELEQRVLERLAISLT